MKVYLRVLMCWLALHSSFGLADSFEGLKFAGTSQKSILTGQSNFGRFKSEATSGMVLSASRELLNRGQVSVDQLNVVAFGLPQEKISGQRAKKKLGSLSFVLQKEGTQLLSYSADKKKLWGRVKGRVAFSQLAEIYPDKLDNKKDHYSYPLADSAAFIEIDLEQALEPLGEALETVVTNISSVKFRIVSKKLGGIDQFKFDVFVPKFKFDFTWLRSIRSVSYLCLQPVRFTDGPSDADPTGDGWSFGRPGMEQQWAKAGVFFIKRAWMSVDNGNLKEVSNQETLSVRQSVQSPDCVEVFFAESFSPQDMFGGGATFASGTADAQIISSDENADFGVDLTHLAHEMGHVVNLHHPGQGFPQTSSTLMDSSSGTLMCGSGFNNDNPTLNSEDNADRLSNPLLTFGLRYFGGQATSLDCESSFDCGGC